MICSHAIHPPPPSLPTLLCVLSPKGDRSHAILHPLFLLPKTNKDVKHQSSFFWVNKRRPQTFSIMFDMLWGFTNQRNNNGTSFFGCCCCVSVFQRLSRPNLSPFFDLVGSNYSKVVLLSSSSSPLLRAAGLLQHIRPLSPLTVPFHPPDYDTQSSRLKQQSVRVSLSFEVHVSYLCFSVGPER